MHEFSGIIKQEFLYEKYFPNLFKNDSITFMSLGSKADAMQTGKRAAESFHSFRGVDRPRSRGPAAGVSYTSVQRRGAAGPAA
jgi:hypothetical protein